MFAIVKISGHQYKVQAGQQIYVSHIEGNAGDKVEFAEVLLVDNDGKLSVGKDVKEKVQAEIIGEKQGDKVIAFKMKRRKGFRKKIGHRKLYTRIKIESIA
jgi:large subunit ribosomal protein L21